jgi:hypothetical protein
MVLYIRDPAKFIHSLFIQEYFVTNIKYILGFFYNKKKFINR